MLIKTANNGITNFIFSKLYYYSLLKNAVRFLYRKRAIFVSGGLKIVCTIQHTLRSTKFKCVRYVVGTI